LGGGSIFFSQNVKYTSFLSDINEDLINCYNQVKLNPLEIISTIKKLPQSKEMFYEMRSKKIINNLDRAVRFIYLNKTSFNGVYRVNLKGEYNVPYGKKTFNIDILSELINSCSLKLRNSKIYKSDYSSSILNITKNDLIYIDPPYTITHNNNGFIKYNEKLFSIVDQYKLSQQIKYIKEKGAYYILSNAHHPDILKIYDKYGDKVIKLSRKSLISSSVKSRTSYDEYLFTNIY
jgi:DNA adenine methylase